MESNAAAQGSEIMSNDGGRGAEGERHAIGQYPALGDEGFWETVEDEVEVEFACDGDVKTGMGNWSSDCGVLQVPQGRKLQPTGNPFRGAESAAPPKIFPSQILSSKTIPSSGGCAFAVGFIPE
jgi:hypothetical protein